MLANVLSSILIIYENRTNLSTTIVFTAEPSAPRHLKVTDTQVDSISISWEAPESDGGVKLKRYVIVIKEKSGKKFKKVGKVAIDVLTFQITERIEAGGEYLIQVSSWSWY